MPRHTKKQGAPRKSGAIPPAYELAILPDDDDDEEEEEEEQKRPRPGRGRDGGVPSTQDLLLSLGGYGDEQKQPRHSWQHDRAAPSTQDLLLSLGGDGDEQKRPRQAQRARSAVAEEERKQDTRERDTHYSSQQRRANRTSCWDRLREILYRGAQTKPRPRFRP